MILPGNIKFIWVKNLRVVTYWFKRFRGKKTRVLSDFEIKYKNVLLNIENKQRIFDTIKNNLKYKNYNKLINILFSIQLFIYYLTNE